MTDEQGDPTARSLTLRPKGEMVQFSGLVNRGLELSGALKHVEAHDEEGPADPWAYLRRQAVKDLRDKNLDKRAAAAKRIIDFWAELVTNDPRSDYRYFRTIGEQVAIRKLGVLLGLIRTTDPLGTDDAFRSRYLGSWSRKLHHLLLPLADSLYTLFESQSWKEEGGWHGREYFPPDERLRKLLLEALRVFDPTIALSFEGASLLLVDPGSNHGIEAAVWLAKHDPERFHGLERLELEQLKLERLKLELLLVVGDPHGEIRVGLAAARLELELYLKRQKLGRLWGVGDPHGKIRVRLAAALIELGHSRSSVGERVLLQAVEEGGRGIREAFKVIRLMVRKLNSPESFLQAGCQRLMPRSEEAYVHAYHLKPLVLEIIRRRGPDALAELQRTRGLSDGEPPDQLVLATYDALNRIEGLDLEYDLDSDLEGLLKVNSFDDASLDDFLKYQDALRPWAIRFADFLEGRDDVRRYREAMSLPVTVDEFLKDWHERLAEYVGSGEEEEHHGDKEEFSNLAEDSRDLDLAWQCLMERLERILKEAG